MRDSRGFLWFCTGEGLSRFDGYSFVNYGVTEGLPHPTVNDLLQTRSGDYWIATNGGLCRFNPKGAPTSHPVYAVDSSSGAIREAMFTTYTPSDNDQLSKAINTVIEKRDGGIWLGTRKGLFNVDRGSGRVELRAVDIEAHNSRGHEYISSILEDRYGTMWIGTPTGLYRRWPDGGVARYGKGNGIPDENIQALLEDRRGNLWVGTRFSGLFKLAIGAGHEAPIIMSAYNRRTGNDWVFDIYESSDGALRAGTNSELLEFHSDDEQHLKPTRIDTKGSGFSYHEIESVSEDRDGNVWLGAVTGAMKIARNGFRTLNEGDGLSGITSLFESPAGDLYAYGYVLGDGQASVFDGGKFDPMNPDSVNYWFSLGRLEGQRFTWLAPKYCGGNGWTDKPYILQSSYGEWWIGQATGLHLYPRIDSFAGLKTARPLAVYTTRNGLSSPVVYSIYEDRRGDLWISTFSSTGNGLARWERATRTVRDLTRTEGLPSLKDNLAATFAEDRAGHVWVGFQPGGLARYEGDRFKFFTIEDGLPLGKINDLHLDQAGRLWVATSRGGVSRVDEPNSDRPAFVNYSTEQGLSSNVATAITDDLYGRIYVGAGRGVDQITVATGQIKHFTTADGLASGEILSAARDRTGRVWFAARRGLSHFLPEREHTSEPPRVLINGLLVAGARQRVSAVGEDDISLPDLSPGENQLQIDFVGLSFAPGESLRYQYRLEGDDVDWSAPTEQRAITYAKLSPGQYRFLVRAVNSVGVLSPRPAIVSFKILSPIWRRWWFIAMAGALAGALAYAVYRYRVAQLVELERVRTRIAADLHDDIGSNLSQISVLSEVLRNQLGEQEARVSKNLTLINRVSQEALDSMSDIVWAINPQQDKLSDLVRRMRRVASEALPARDIEFTFNAPAPGLDLKLGADIRRQVFLMFKETINNLVRHSKCTLALIDLRIEGACLALTVADNGKGFDPDQVNEGNGIISLHRRARSLGGETAVSSRKGEGATVMIKVPYSNQSRLRRSNGKV
ncbi:MAG TPA: two-component regulator propeller domain-containing protein [Blastocatellia bacterium]|nr:two-component regulator propeller domain-containing protein [Blastocatellia bacterium]